MKKYQILENLVRFNTVKDHDNSAIVDYLEKILSAKGFKTDHKGKNLIMSYGDSPTFGFLGHTDTVEYIDGWSTDPFELTGKSGKLYGLGTCDMKSGIAAIIDAISATDLSKLTHGIKLYFTYDEEIGFNGVKDLVQNQEKFPDFMVFGEPTHNEILIGSKGLLCCELHFKGKKAHSSNPEKGESANLNAIRLLNKLETFYLEKIKPQLNQDYDIPYTTMNVGLLQGGSAINSIPANCRASLDFRLTNPTHAEIILTKIHELCPKYHCQNTIFDNIAPFMSTFKNFHKTANFITEASFINAKTKIILGAGPVTAHEVDEHIDSKSYDKLVEQYKNLIQTHCAD